MRLLISTAIALTAALVAAGPTIDLAAAPKNRPNIKVIVSFQDRPGDRILGDNVYPYDYQDGVGGVVAYIAPGDGQLIFGTNVYNRAGRTLQFFFSDCLWVPANCQPPSSDLNERSGLQANILNSPGRTGGLLAMTTGEELPMFIKFNIPWDSDPAYWNVCFDSGGVYGPCGAAPGGTSTDARIYRDAGDRWTIFANGIEARGDLIKDVQKGKSRTFTVMGTYSMPFAFTVQCVNSADCS